LHVLARIYLFLGWLGLIGSGILLFGIFSSRTIPIGGSQTGLFGLSPQFSVLFLICWSILLMSFSKDLTGARKWATAPLGILISCIHLLSVPVGTVVGLYTLWVLTQLHHW